MCARYVLERPGSALAILGLGTELAPRFNVAPAQQVPAVRPGPELAMLRWGLVPSWSRTGPRGRPLVNARAETAGVKPSFRRALSRRRCLLPADGFYEWERGGRPWCFRLRGAGPFAFAGIWERWRSPEGRAIESCALLTVPANQVVARVHPRMPAILLPPLWEPWLDPGLERPLGIVAPLGPGLIEGWPVGRRVGSWRNDDPGLISPAG